MILNNEQFKELLKQDKPVLVDFYADWCGPCRIQAPIIEEVAEEVKDFAIVGKINVDKERDLARQYSIMSIPTLIIFKEGKVVERISGLTQKQRLVELLNQAR
ncbi:MAG: thioredoxin [Acholeplasmataceae bacterium]|nr:thioredoxin [Acholeplasmataceae bacterium]HPT89744.1 thioredoxin [Bacilli bacterium]HQA19683.1 thioredoxin [Bacilli bacterium]HQD92564.1 thioredoxin [Bacilli bacterium]